MDETEIDSIPLPVKKTEDSSKTSSSNPSPSWKGDENNEERNNPVMSVNKPELYKDGVKMTQNIVDELFKDFLAKKMNQIESEAKNSEVVDSVEEMNKFLDAELSEMGEKHLQKDDNYSSRKHRKSSKEKRKDREKSSKKREKRHSQERKRGHDNTSTHTDSKIKKYKIDDTEENVEEKPALIDAAASVETKEVSGKKENHMTEKNNFNESAVTSTNNKAEELPENDLNVLQKKTGPKQLSLKISSFSSNLITSGDRIKMSDGKSKSYEEGEISTSENSSAESGIDSEDEEEDEDMGHIEPSETGSLSDSDKDKHSKKKKKKKKKHKHKKKKKAKLKYKEKDRDGVEKKNSRSRSPRRSGHSHSESRRHSRSHSRERNRHSRDYSSHHKDDDRDYRSRRRRRSPSHSRDRSRSKSSEREVKDLRVKINKAKLRQIAIKNALANSMMGQGPAFDLNSIKARGKSVNELTDLCKTISSKEKGFSDYSTSEEEEPLRKSDDEDNLIQHPFVLNPAKDIVMNIRNAKQLPIYTPQEKIAQSAHLRLQFPVSSGSQHRLKESEWVPVNPTTAPTAVKTTVTKAAAVTTSNTNVTNSKVKAPTIAIPTMSSTVTAAAAAVDLAAAVVKAPLPVPVRPEDKVFPDSKEDIDIGAIISQRLNAYRKLKSNPHDLDAMRTISAASKKASLWAQSKQLPGQFSGSTGAQIMSQEDLIGPDKKNQAWSLKYSVNRAAPVSGGIGMFLLKKMGWKMGEGLGKDNKGPTQPLLLDFKIDRKGLSSAEEGKKSKPFQNASAPLPKDLSGKHPVSALTELCNKRRWGPPEFLLVHESGPDHKKNFIFKVVVNNVEYQPSVSSQTKKMAKSMSATVCLQSLGLLPRTSTENPS